ncbi:MAG: hypothetical protein LBU65_16500, partial [Planctomycetaceae bacterium]|nr:hypothetical protein [Planctomycetaceae bacterium]
MPSVKHYIIICLVLPYILNTAFAQPAMPPTPRPTTQLPQPPMPSYQPANQWDGYSPKTNNLNPPIPQIQPNGNVAMTTKTPTVMLLKTGMLVEGTIKQIETGYQVKTYFGSMTVPLANVERLGSSKQEIYQYKQSLVFSENTQDLIKLAEWCLANNMKEEGIAEYRRAKESATNQHLVKYIEERLATLTNVKSNSDYVMLPSETPETENVSEYASNNGTNIDDNLGVWSAKVPRSVYDGFAKKIQPILVNRCGASDCHGSKSESEFVLFTTRQHGTSATMRNLRSTLKYIDSTSPNESPLLALPMQIHGRTKPVFTKQNHAQFETLQQWVTSVVTSSIVQRNHLLTEQSANQAEALSNWEKVPIWETVEPNQQPVANEWQPSEKKQMEKPKSQPPIKRTDPFDPENFN